MKFTILAVAVVFSLPMAASDANAHGCHRNSELGPAGWHRHVGRSCARVATSRPYSYGRRGDRCVERCSYIGPIKQCERVC